MLSSQKKKKKKFTTNIALGLEEYWCMVSDNFYDNDLKVIGLKKNVFNCSF
jgi:hypothetical protein